MLFLYFETLFFFLFLIENISVVCLFFPNHFDLFFFNRERENTNDKSTVRLKTHGEKWNSFQLQVKVHDLRGGDAPAEAQHGGRDDDGRRAAGSRDDGTHRRRQNELGQKHHTGH